MRGHPTRHYGLTLIELLVSISLLGSVLVAGGSWLKTTATLSTKIQADRHWNSAASALIRSIHDDVRSGDLERASDAGTDSDTFVVWAPPELSIWTRQPGRGPVTHRYFLEQEAIWMSLESGDLSAPPLLMDVASFECLIDETQAWLDVTLRSKDDQIVARRIQLK